MKEIEMKTNIPANTNTVTVVMPPYVRMIKNAAGKPALFWGVPNRYKVAGFKPANLALGTDIAKSLGKVTGDLLPRLRAFQSGAVAIAIPGGPVPGTLDDWVHTYQTNPMSTYITNCCEKWQKALARLLEAGTDHEFRDGPYKGRRVGSLTEEELTSVEACRLRLEFAKVEEVETNPDTGESKTVVRDRARSAELVFDAFKGVFNAIRGLRPDAPKSNPFERLKFKSRMRKQHYAADFYDLLATLIAGEETDLRNVATIAFVAYDLKIRVESIGSRLMVEHYKPADRPFQMLITQWKTKKAVWIHLRDEDGEPLYPALESRLDACKAGRTGGILIPRDGTADQPWGDAKAGTMTTEFYAVFRSLMDAAGLPEECKLTSFRHGGITESAEAGCTINEMMVLSGHTHVQTVQLYARKTRRGREAAQKKVLADRAKRLARLTGSGAAKVKHVLALPAVAAKAKRTLPAKKTAKRS
jgi:hypothetical protein